MSQDVIEGEVVSTALTVKQAPPAARLPAPQLLDALRPAERVALMTEIANVIKDVIEKQKWYKQIGPKKHILIQGWTFIGGLGGCSAKTTHTEPIDGGYKAHATVVRVDSGIEVGSADQVCLSKESNWRGKDDYALIGMASTRACSRALSTVFRHVVELAGYSATPAEEMTGIDKGPAPAPAPREEPRRPQREAPPRASYTEQNARQRDAHPFADTPESRGRSAHGKGAPVSLLNEGIQGGLWRDKAGFVDWVRRNVPGGAGVTRSSDVEPGSQLYETVATTIAFHLNTGPA